MKLNEAKRYAKIQLGVNGLTNWKFRFDRTKLRVGHCDFSIKTITMSKPLFLLNSQTQFHDTLMHEIAHAIVGVGHGHDDVWKTKAVSLGCNGQRMAGNEVIQAPRTTILICPNCKHESHRYKKSTKLACRDCCDKYNNGKFTERFIMKVKQ